MIFRKLRDVFNSVDTNNSGRLSKADVSESNGFYLMFAQVAFSGSLGIQDDHG
jgi:hypothetical protein